MPTTRLRLEYDGAGFAGWAAQPGRRTVEGELEAALATLAREPVKLVVAGRTDAGVHALGQVASFETRAELDHAGLLRSLNGVLGDDVAVLAAEAAPEGFSARHDARSRTYRYRLLRRAVASPFERGRALWWPHDLDLAALEACAAALVGRHDFRAFSRRHAADAASARSVLRAEWLATGDRLDFVVEAESFLRGMVRALVGTMLEVGQGRRRVAQFEGLLQGASRERGGQSAPAHGLYLESVAY